MVDGLVESFAAEKSSDHAARAIYWTMNAAGLKDFVDAIPS